QPSRVCCHGDGEPGLLWPTPTGRPGLTRLTSNQLIEHGRLRFRAQDTAQALDILARGRRAAGDDGYVGVWQVDAFVEDAASHQLEITAGTEALEHRPPLPRLGPIRDGRDEQAVADRVNERRVLSENEHSVVAVPGQELG